MDSRDNETALPVSVVEHECGRRVTGRVVEGWMVRDTSPNFV
jgi:hypothetical protein